jgi:metal-responsive CopG/Arc/MetJ family transcriptional regulator
MSTNNTKQKRVGRPRVDSEEVQVRIQRPLLDALDSYIAKETDSIGRPEAIRRLVKEALDARSGRTTD